MDGAQGQPSGVLTLLFTDIEGSTRLIRALPAQDSLAAFALHGQVLRDVVQRYGGYEQRTEGDSFFLVFQDASVAVAAAADAQRLLAAQSWPGGLPVRVRMGLHTGEPTPVDGDYFGLDVHRAARISSAGHGGQVLLSRATQQAAQLPAGVTLRDLGEHRLKDLARPEWIFQLEIDGLDRDFPPLNSLETPTNLPAGRHAARRTRRRGGRGRGAARGRGRAAGDASPARAAAARPGSRSPSPDGSARCSATVSSSST